MEKIPLLTFQQGCLDDAASALNSAMYVNFPFRLILCEMSTDLSLAEIHIVGRSLEPCEYGMKSKKNLKQGIEDGFTTRHLRAALLTL
jgi:hypothetical protein